MANRGTSRAPGIWPRLPWLGRIHTANLSPVSAWPGCKALVSRPIRLDMFYLEYHVHDPETRSITDQSGLVIFQPFNNQESTHFNVHTLNLHLQFE